MFRHAIIAAALTLAAAGPAFAQSSAESIAGLFAAETDSLGSSVGQSLAGGETIFVYAQGRAKANAAQAGHPQGYLTNIEAEAATAVEAARLRDAKLAAIREAAARFGADLKIDNETYSIKAARPVPPVPVMPTAPAAPPMPVPPAPPARPAANEGPHPFIARATVRFSVADVSKTPALLDAVRAAGADNLQPDFVNLIPGRAGIFGLEALPPMDDAVWQAASADAFRSAREQAKALAAAAGRELGAARQITYLARSADGQGASITIAVRFSLLPLH